MLTFVLVHFFSIHITHICILSFIHRSSFENMSTITNKTKLFVGKYRGAGQHSPLLLTVSTFLSVVSLERNWTNEFYNFEMK